MSTIGIKCVDQVMTFENMPIITAGDQNVDKVQFDFCPLWDGFVKVAVFFQQKTELSYALINADGSCNIPNSILKLSGKIFIAVTGTNTSNQVRTSNILSYFVDEGIVDADIQDEFPSEITEEEKEDIYNKILEMCVEMQNLCQDLITNFAYVRIEGANEFEYDESALEAKIRAYTYAKDSLYTRNEIDNRVYDKNDTYSKNEVYAKSETYPKSNYTIVSTSVLAPTAEFKILSAKLPDGFTIDNSYMVGVKHYRSTSADMSNSVIDLECSELNITISEVNNQAITISVGNSSGFAYYHKVEMLFMKI